MTIAKKLEGKTRPDFFGGVCMVVLKLFNIIRPHYTYFGEKDIQQLFVVQKMIKDLNFPVVLRPCSTIRETNGLAMSSRNQYLSDIEQNEATILYQALKKGKDLILEEKNRKLLEKGTVVYLQTSIQSQLERTMNDKERPLLQGNINKEETLRKIASERNPVYEALTDITIQETNTPDESVNAIIKELNL